MDLVKVENETLARDINSNAILETDVRKLHRHRAMIAAIDEKEKKVDDLLARINNLEKLIERMANNG